jgi:hypothetical protein
MAKVSRPLEAMAAGTKAAAAASFLAGGIFEVGAEGALVVDEFDEPPDEQAAESNATLATASTAALVPMDGRERDMAPPLR